MKYFYLLIILSSFLCAPRPGKAQLPQRDRVYVLMYNIAGGSSVRDSLFTYDPSLPVSATNPSLNTIEMPMQCVGLAVSPVLGSSDTTLTFYTTVNGTFWYYNHNTSTWTNTGHTIGQPAAINIGAGGGYIYTFQAQGSFPSVYRYDGTGTPTSVAGGMISPRPYDLIADCSGNFYIMGGGLAGIWFINKYNSAGSAIQGYTLNNPNNWMASGGIANIGHDIYTDNFASKNFIHSVINSTSATVIDTTAIMPFMVAGHRVDDMATVGGSLSDILPVVTLHSNDTIACGGNLATVHSQVTNAGSNGTYQWYVNGMVQTSADSIFSFHPTSITDTVALHYTTGGSCGNITAMSTGLIIHVTNVVQPLLSMRDTLICIPGPVGLTVKVSNLNGNMKFRWSPATALVSAANTQSVVASGAASANFIVTVTDSASATCVKRMSDTLHLTVSDATGFKVTGTTAICAGDTAWLHARGGSSYAWLNTKNIAYSTDSDIVTLTQATTTYKVKIANSAGCSKVLEMPVTVNKAVMANAGADEYIKAGDTAKLHATGGGFYHWYPVNYLLPDSGEWIKAAPFITTQYFVRVTSIAGCTATDSVTVHVVHTSIPNAFTPNGDGLNDRFHLKFDNPNAALLGFSIYNRWGAKVYYTNQLTEGWDGNYLGSPADMGTYYYMATYTIGAKTYADKGDVVLIR